MPTLISCFPLTQLTLIILLVAESSQVAKAQGVDIDGMMTLIPSPGTFAPTILPASTSNPFAGIGKVQSNDVKDIHFLAYTDPSNPKKYNEIKVGDLALLKAANMKKGNVIILNEGFYGNVGTLLAIKDAYMSKGVTNIILADYQSLMAPQSQDMTLSLLAYVPALKNIPKIGGVEAKLINFLHENKIFKDTSQVHLIGNSLGSHVSASAGYYLQKKYGKTLGRITGLDVAGPLNVILKKHKFSKKYANFVDSIHTNVDGLGTPESLAHADFFLNGGKSRDQAGCPESPPDKIFCAHQVAVGLYLASITTTDDFIGCECKGVSVPDNPAKVPTLCRERRGPCKSPTVVGAYCPTTARGNFYVKDDRHLNFNSTTVARRPETD